MSRCFCSFLHGVLEGLPGLYIETQTYFNCPCSAVPQSAVLFTSVRNKSRLRKAEILGWMKQNRRIMSLLPDSCGPANQGAQTLSMVIKIKKKKTSTEAQLPVLVMQGEIHSNSNPVRDRNLICVFLICSYDDIQKS